jgi:hypothetical protein
MMSENENVNVNRDDFVATPHHDLVAAFHDADSLKQAVSGLREKGFPQDSMRSFVGDEGMRALDFVGATHGLAAELLRYFQGIGPDRTYLERYERYMKDGDSLLMVHAPTTQQKESAAEILRRHSPHRITYFGTLVIEEV